MQAFELLERCAVKVARTVLRRGGGGNASLLSDWLKLTTNFIMIFGAIHGKEKRQQV
jgi:hypothetical protein